MDERGRAGLGGRGIGRRAWLGSFFCMFDNSSDTFDAASALGPPRNTTPSCPSLFTFSGESGFDGADDVGGGGLGLVGTPVDMDFAKGTCGFRGGAGTLLEGLMVIGVTMGGVVLGAPFCNGKSCDARDWGGRIAVLTGLAGLIVSSTSIG